ncbi:MAG: glycosyltransferase family 2 protein [Synechococcus sp.]
MQPRVTVVVSPRERFNYTEQSLNSIYKNTEIPFELIYVDGNSPRSTQRYLEMASKEKGFKLLRTQRYLRPNQARNLSLPHIKTEYVVFVDNDLFVNPGWLKALVKCSDETGAWIVGPLYFEGQPEDETIHMFGGLAHFREIRGQREFYEQHRYRGKKLSSIASNLQREKTETVEFHCTLAKMTAFERLGPLDEGLKTACEHLDFALSVREVGKEVYIEPASKVTYVTPPPFAVNDLPFFLWRWSDSATRETMDRFSEKWNLPNSNNYSKRMLTWCTHHRCLAWKPIQNMVARWFPKLGRPRLSRLIDRFVTPLLNLLQPILTAILT